MRFKKSIFVLAWGAVLLLSGVALPAPYWRKVNVNHPGQICGVAMSPSGQHIVINGDFALHSSDRGVTWEMTSGFVPFIMDYGDESHVFGVASNPQSGSNGVYRCSDYGKTWMRIGLPENLIYFNEVDFIDSVHGWAVGNKDFIVTTNDGWQTWTAKPYGVSGISVGGVSFIDTLQGWVGGGLVGTDTSVLSTTDGGNTWSRHLLGLPFSGAGPIDFVDSLHGWLIGGQYSRNKVFYTSDGGNSWVEQGPLVGLNDCCLDGVEAVDSLHAWIFGNLSAPVIWKTTDGGKNWNVEYIVPGDYLTDFDMVDTAHGVAVGAYNLVVIYAPFVLGDLSKDGLITAADVVLELNKVFLGQSFPAPLEAGDVNCDSLFTASDVVLLLNRAFLSTAFPCDPG